MTTLHPRAKQHLQLEPPYAKPMAGQRALHLVGVFLLLLREHGLGPAAWRAEFRSFEV